MESSPAPTPLIVGVYDEPEVVVSGIAGMLSREGLPARVRAFSPYGSDVALDLVLCDPVARDVQIEEYLAYVGSLTKAPVLVFTWSPSAPNLRRSLASGARGLLSKDADAGELAAALVAVSHGHGVTPRAASPHHARPIVGPGSRQGSAGLSTREAEVLNLICRGLSNLEIAAALFVSVNSVKTYVRQVYQKIGVSRRSQAVAWGIGHGF